MSDEHPSKIDNGSILRCKFPALTPSLIELMAHAGFATMEEQDGAATPTSWSNVTDGVRECWRFIAKRMYAAAAVHSGARAEGIREDPA